MDRREALKRVGLLLGGTLSASVVAGVLSGCEVRRRAGTYTPQALTAAQDELVTTVAELILPETDTPGARAAGVNQFVDGIVATTYSDAEKARFTEGLADLDRRAQAAHRHAFAACTPAQQADLLTALAREADAARQAGDTETPFFFMMKELTLVGYYTSEVGATQELQYVHAAGRYDGDVPLAEAGRAYA
jgi:hypothetical protein